MSTHPKGSPGQSMEGDVTMKAIPILLTMLSLLISCQRFEPTGENRTQKDLAIDVIYGEDNRIDFFEITDPDWLRLAQSTVALVDHDDLVISDNPRVFQLKGDTYGYVFHLCPDESFFEQPSSSFCSGFLVGSDLVVTAGHCIRNEFNCEDVRLVFDFSYTTQTTNPNLIPIEKIYHCKELIHSESNGLTGSDFALVRLDRPVIDRSPLPIRTEGSLALDEELTVIGYPSGLPGKWADGGLIRNIENPHYVVASLDTYGGNSGSAVFNSETRQVEGILARGEKDFIFDQEDRCRRSNSCDEQSCRGEDVVRIEKIFDHITPKDLR